MIIFVQVTLVEYHLKFNRHLQGLQLISGGVGQFFFPIIVLKMFCLIVIITVGSHLLKPAHFYVTDQLMLLNWLK